MTRAADLKQVKIQFTPQKCFDALRHKTAAIKKLTVINGILKLLAYRQ